MKSIRPKCFAVCFIILSLTVVAISHAAPAVDNNPNLVPWPKSVVAGQGHKDLDAGCRIVAQDAALEPLARVLADEIYLSTAVRLPVTTGNGGKNDITLRLGAGISHDEGYILTVGPEGVVIEGRNYRGVAWGTVTLLQSIENSKGKLSIPFMTVKDEPVASYRGLLIDIGRQWHPLETMRPIIEMCRLYKINYLQLHLNDNTEGNVMAFPSKAFPSLATQRKGKTTTYTIEEITGLVKYADERGVTIVPEISGPGAHSGPLRGIWGRGNTLDVWNEKTYEGLSVLIGEAAAVFKSSPYIHLGGDEGVFKHLGQSPEEKAYMESKGVKGGPLNYYLRRMDEIVKKNGKKTICWEGFGGDGGGLPKDIIVMPYESQFNPADSLVKHGFSVINTAWKPLYVVNGRKWEPEYIYDSWNMRLWEHHVNLKCHIQLKESDPVIGAQLCAWEQRPEIELPSTRTRIPVLSERTWNPSLGRKYSEYLPRAVKADQLLDRVLGIIPVRHEGLSGKEDRGFQLCSGTVTATLSPVPVGTARYTLDGTDPTAESKEYSGPIPISRENAHVEKLFYNRRVGRYEAQGDVARLRARMFDSAGQPIGDVITIWQYWFKSPEEQNK